jgi:hypothetical protein
MLSQAEPVRVVPSAAAALDGAHVCALSLVRQRAHVPLTERYCQIGIALSRYLHRSREPRGPPGEAAGPVACSQA